MKRLICMLLITALLAVFPGCSEADGDSVSFYYLRTELSYSTEDGVIAPEARAISGSREDLNYLLRLYLEGPLTDMMTSPFPVGTQLISVEQEDSSLLLELSGEFAALEGIDLTMAGACLASTCFALTDAEAVQITAGTPEDNISITLTRNSLTLLDDSAVGTEASEAGQ